MPSRFYGSNGLKKAAGIFRLLVAAILAAGTLTSCFQAVSPTGQPEPDESQAAAIRLAAEQGGNLHYQNLVLAVGEQIIFNNEGSQLSIARPDGSDSRQLTKQTGGNLASQDDLLFYTIGGPVGALAKIGLDGTNQVRIGSTSLKYLICSQQALYAIESDSGRVISLRPDGTGRQVLLDQKAGALALAEDRLYISGLEGDTGVQALNLVSGEKALILNVKASSLNVAGSWLYYADPDRHYLMYAWSLTDQKEYAGSDFAIEKPFVTSGGYLYYISADEQNRLFRQPLRERQCLEKSDAMLVVDDAVGAFAVINDFIYYQRPESRRIYRVSTAGGRPVRIA